MRDRDLRLLFRTGPNEKDIIADLSVTVPDAGLRITLGQVAGQSIWLDLQPLTADAPQVLRSDLLNSVPEAYRTLGRGLVDGFTLDEMIIEDLPGSGTPSPAPDPHADTRCPAFHAQLGPCTGSTGHTPWSAHMNMAGQEWRGDVSRETVNPDLPIGPTGKGLVGELCRIQSGNGDVCNLRVEHRERSVIHQEWRRLRGGGWGLWSEWRSVVAADESYNNRATDGQAYRGYPAPAPASGPAEAAALIGLAAARAFDAFKAKVPGPFPDPDELAESRGGQLLPDELAESRARHPGFALGPVDVADAPSGDYPGTCIGCTAAQIVAGHREDCPDRVPVDRPAPSEP